jgi:hypothetical protein
MLHPRQDGRALPHTDSRDKLKLAIVNRRDAVEQIIKRMEAKNWFTNAPVLDGDGPDKSYVAACELAPMVGVDLER